MLSRGVVAGPTRSSKNIAKWENLKKMPQGFLLDRSAVQNGAIQRVLEGDIGTIEGGSLLFHELIEEGIEASADLTPMHLSGQLRRMQEQAIVDPEIAAIIQALRAHKCEAPQQMKSRQIATILVCSSWHPPNCERVGCGCGCARCRRGDAPSPALTRSKSRIESYFDCVIESRAENHHQQDKLFYLSVCRRAGVLPEETIYVGKHRDYLDAAAAVGITTVSNITPFHTVKAISSLVNISIPLINK
jgi:hypothetical protein